MSDYEKLLMNIIINAGEKIIDASALLKTKYSYRDVWYLTIIAEEELAKIIVLPFAVLAGNITDLASRPSILYKHPVKQKLFTSYGLQNRSHSNMENLKQKCLYVEPEVGGKYLRVVSEKEAEDEIKHALRLFNQIAITNILIAKSPSTDFKKVLKKYVEDIFTPAIKIMAPSVIDETVKGSEIISEETTLLDAVRRYPLLFAEMITFALLSNYKQFFKEIQGLSYDEMIRRLNTYI